MKYQFFLIGFGRCGNVPAQSIKKSIISGEFLLKYLRLFLLLPFGITLPLEQDAGNNGSDYNSDQCSESLKRKVCSGEEPQYHSNCTRYERQ